MTEYKPEPIVSATRLRPVEGLERGTRLRSEDYGPGTIVSIMDNRILIWWDRAVIGDTNQLEHDRVYVEGLERL